MPPPERQKIADWLQFKTLDDPELIKMVEKSAEWLKAFKESRVQGTQVTRRWITYLGPSGNGKTHCATRLFLYAKNTFAEAQQWQYYSFIPHVIYWPDFVHKLRAGEAFAKREELKRWPVLCLDDIGAERDTTGFASEELNTLLGCRMDKWTILTANLTMSELEKIDARIASRIIRDKNILVQCKAEDYAGRC